MLQGGGALGSYQAGVHEALARSDYQPDWVAGISIGAINAAIIAGNPPEHRVERLRLFWERVTEPRGFWAGWLEGLVPPPAHRRTLGAAEALLFGQPGFFAPQPATSWFGTTPPRWRARWIRWSISIASTTGRCGFPSAP